MLQRRMFLGIPFPKTLRRVRGSAATRAPYATHSRIANPVEGNIVSWASRRVKKLKREGSKSFELESRRWFRVWIPIVAAFSVANMWMGVRLIVVMNDPYDAIAAFFTSAGMILLLMSSHNEVKFLGAMADLWKGASHEQLHFLLEKVGKTINERIRSNDITKE